MIKNDDHCIFDNLVANENAFTNLTHSLLSIKKFRIMFESFLFEETQIDGKYNFSDYSTQYSIGENGQPDLVLTDDNTEIFIEVKIGDAELTKNQPYNYLKHLKSIDKQKKMFCFLLPKNYKHKSQCDKKIKEFHNRNANNGIYTKILHWEDLHSYIRNHSKDLHENPIICHYDKLLKSRFLFEEVEFNSENIRYMNDNKRIPDTLEKLTQLIDNVKKELKNNEFNIKDQKSKDFTHYGFSICDNEDDKILFFGCYLPFWKELGSPIVLQLEYEDYNYPKDFKKVCKKLDVDYEFFEKEDYVYHVGKISNNLLFQKKQQELVVLIKSFSEQLIQR